MAKLSEALKTLLDNPDDLSTLPQLIAKAEEMEGQDAQYQERIDKLQQINRNYLAQIPIPGQEPKEDEKEKVPTMEDAKAYIINTLQGGTQ